MNNEHDPVPRSFGRARPPAPEDQPALDFNALRGGGTALAATPPRWMSAVLPAIMLGFLLGGLYFIHVTLAFKSAVMANTTTIYGPYPPFAVIFAVIPAYCGIFYFLLDLFRLKTGISPFTNPRGIAVSTATAIILIALIYWPISLIRHNDNAFAAGHGYIRCSSLFDPHHLRVYALKNYVDVYGCPTVSLPQ